MKYVVFLKIKLLDEAKRLFLLQKTRQKNKATRRFLLMLIYMSSLNGESL